MATGTIETMTRADFNVRVRNVENDVVIGVSEDIADGLCVSGAFERVDGDEKAEPKKPVKKAAAKTAPKKSDKK